MIKRIDYSDGYYDGDTYLDKPDGSGVFHYNNGDYISGDWP